MEVGEWQSKQTNMMKPPLLPLLPLPRSSRGEDDARQASWHCVVDWQAHRPPLGGAKLLLLLPLLLPACWTSRVAVQGVLQSTELVAESVMKLHLASRNSSLHREQQAVVGGGF